MIKKLIYLFGSSVHLFTLVNAQNPHSINAPTDKNDTTFVRQYITPPRNPAFAYKKSAEVRPFIIYKPNLWLRRWHTSISTSINFSQSAFTSGYSTGGISAIALNGNIIYKIEYKKQPFSYATEINSLYGIAKNKGQGSRKTNDRIFIDNKVATKLSKHWSFFGSLSFESQFDRGYKYTDETGRLLQTPLILSRFMAPGYFTESFGFEYKPASWFSTRLGTGAAKQTIVLDTTIYRNNAANYGVPIGKIFKNDLAFQMVSQLDKDVLKNIHLNARYAFLIPYEKSLDYITNRIDAILIAKVNKLISLTINGSFLYDKTTSNQIQGTEGMALGIIYKSL